MPGYILLEQSQLQPHRDRGIVPFSNGIGLLDFLRELAQEDFPFRRLEEICLVGLEEILFAASPQDRELAAEIHRRLQRSASDLERRQMTVQVVFQGKLIRGNTLWVEFRGKRLPIDAIFDSPVVSTDASGNKTYRVHFNLTSPSP